MKQCPICLHDFTQLDVHHITPRCAGGTDDKHNLIEICSSCHTAIHSQAKNLLSTTVKRKQYLSNDALLRAKPLIQVLIKSDRYIKETDKGVRKLPMLSVSPEFLSKLHKAKLDSGFKSMKKYMYYLLEKEVKKI